MKSPSREESTRLEIDGEDAARVSRLPCDIWDALSEVNGGGVSLARSAAEKRLVFQLRVLKVRRRKAKG